MTTSVLNQIETWLAEDDAPNATGPTITGTQNNETFTVTRPTETFDGLGGVNTVVFSGSLSQYTLTQSSGSISVLNTASGQNGTETLINIQQAKFSDYTVVFDLHSSQDQLVYELYQAAYDRIPDNGGFRYWANVADSSNASAIALADAFISAPEFSQKYGNAPDNSTYVSELYTNVLGRIPDPAGLNYWISQANAGVARDQLLVDFATSPENVSLIGQHIADGYWTV
jgi:hypothetical protein